MKKTLYAVIAAVVLIPGTASCSSQPKPVSGEVTKVIYQPETPLKGPIWAVAMRTKSGVVISLTTTGDVDALAAKVTAGSCIVVSGISSTGGNIGSESDVVVTSQHGPCKY